MNFKYATFMYEGEEVLGKVVYYDESLNMYCLMTEEDAEVYLPLSELTPIPALMLTKSDLKALARFEKPFSDFSSDDNVSSDEEYIITSDDIIAAVSNIKKNGYSKEYVINEWAYPMMLHLPYSFEKDDSPEGVWGIDYAIDTFFRIVIGSQYSEDEGSDGISDDGIEADSIGTGNDIVNDLTGSNDSRDSNDSKKNFYELLNVGLDQIRERKKKWFERDFEKEEKEFFVDTWQDRIDEADMLIRMKYREFAEELEKEGNETGLLAVGYGCYGDGNSVFATDWKRSEECMKKLVSEYDNQYAANTLGYIYYYGRTNGGEPMYDEAFRYFTLGAIGGVYESIYKLADMIYQGKGVVKSKGRYFDIMMQLEKETKPQLYKGVRSGKYADVALRLGSYFADELNMPDVAYRYFLDGRFALSLRMKAHDFYGDRKVMTSIEKRIDFYEGVLWDDYNDLVDIITDNTIFGGKEEFILNVNKSYNYDELAENEEYEYDMELLTPSGKMYVIIKNYGYCGFQDRITFKAWLGNEIEEGSYRFDEISEFVLFHKGEEVLLFEAYGLEIDEPDRGEEIMTESGKMFYEDEIVEVDKVYS